MAVPTYRSVLNIDTETARLEPSPLPPSGGEEKIGAAISELAVAGGKVYAGIRQAQDQTQAAVATAEYLTRLDALEQGFDRDREYQTAPKRFGDQQRALEFEIAQNIQNPAVRQLSVLQWRRAGIAAGKRVQTQALQQEADAWGASIDVQEVEALTSASSAGSAAERKAVVDGYIGNVNAGVGSGWITERNAFARAQRFLNSLSRADLARDTRTDPAAAVAKLGDPKNYPGLDPVAREAGMQAAVNARDQILVDELGFTARRDPAAARKNFEVVGPQLQPHNFYRGLQVIDAAEKQNEAELTRMVTEVAKAARSSDDVLQMVKDGYDLNAVRIEGVRNAQITAAARGDQAAAKYLQDLDLAVALAPKVRAAWGLPIAALDAAIKQEETAILAPGADPSPARVEQLKVMQGVRDDIIKRRNTEPIVLGGENGARYYRLNPLDPAAAPEDVALRRELAARDGHARIVETAYGGGGNVFTAEEGRAFKDRYARADPNEQFRMLRALGETLTGRAYTDSVAALTGKDDLAAFVGQTAQARPELAREILQGVALLGDERTRQTATTVRAEVASKFSGEVFPTPAMQQTVINAAIALDASRRGARGALYDATDVSGVSQAIEEIAGPVITRNGGKLPVTPGIAPSRFTDALDNLREDDVAMMGGAIDRSGQKLPAATLRDYGMLKPLAIGGNRYVVGTTDSLARDRFAPVFDLDGRPLIFDMNVLVARQAEAKRDARGELTPYQQKRSQFRAGQAERIGAARRESETAPVEPAAPAPTEPPTFEGGEPTGNAPGTPGGVVFR